MEFGIGYIIGMFCSILVDRLQFRLTEKGCCKKCNYDCSICKNWHCMYKYCERKRSESKK